MEEFKKEKRDIFPKEGLIDLVTLEKKKEILPKDSSKKNREMLPKEVFLDLVFSWSLEDIFNENLYKDKVETIPVSFQSVEHYLGSYVFPLLEDTRAQLDSSMEIINRAPFAEVMSIEEAEPNGALLYDFKVDYWRNRLIDSGRKLYRILPVDILVLSDSKPETLSNHQGIKWTWTLASVTSVGGDDSKDSSTWTKFKVKSSRDLQVKVGEQKPLYVVFLINIMTNIRIWNALHISNNLKIIQKVLHTDHALDEEFCNFCSAHCNINLDGIIGLALNSKLNESQRTSVVTSVSKIMCDHKSHVELIWGPPGTGKTMTVSMILFVLLRMNYRTLSCAPTKAAVMQVAAQVIKLMKESFIAESGRGDLLWPLGDILLFWDNDQMEVGSDVEGVYLNYRVKRLLECLSPVTGWKNCIASMIEFLEDCVSHYHVFVEKESTEMKEQKGHHKASGDERKSFLVFARARFKAIVPSLRRCMIILCTHVPKQFILEQNFQIMVTLVHLLENLELLLFRDSLTSHELKVLYSNKEVAVVEDSFQAVKYTSPLLYLISQCLSILKILRESLGKLPFPRVVNKTLIIEFCFQMASLIFCTASSSFELHLVDMKPMNLLVIDEATQLKESESLIPLQLQGLRHAVLVGDECQLLATSNSKMSYEAGLGRSLFERLGLLGHSRHLLDVQYRMHPSISHFPNSSFYHNKISDGHNVRKKSYQRKYLPGRMFGPYSFINVAEGREESDGDDYSLRNMVEVAVVMKIVPKLYKAWKVSQTSVSIGVISPYPAQVAVIQEKLREKYDDFKGFVVRVDSIDGFQGGEEDIVIISTVKAKNSGSLGFLSSPRSTNVALTRARHCLWILGNERTLINSPSVWESLVCDAKERECFFNADEDPDISKTILNVKGELDQLDDFLNGDSIISRSEKWKVLFSDFFRKSFANLKSSQMKKLVINLLLKLASGWRPARKTVDLVCEKSLMILKKIKVQEFYVLCSNDIVKEFRYQQVLKVWDILPLAEIPKFQTRLDGIFDMYTDDFISLCKEKTLVGKLEVPKSWPNSLNITRYKNQDGNVLIGDSSDTLDGKYYDENSRVSESLLLVKFYSISVGIVNHLFLGGGAGELDAPFEVTDEELEIIRSCRSSFILGRSGTGKTTVLTMKLFQKEQIHHLALEGFTETERSKISGVGRTTWFDNSRVGNKGTVLRQLFVTVNPLLCYAVKQQVSRLKRFSGCVDFPLESSSSEAEDVDGIERDIPDSFVGIPAKKYPLVITFRKFLMMLDGTLGDSYFLRFHDAANCSGGNLRSRKSVSLQTTIRMKEVNHDRFCSLYWPHFNAQLVKNLDPSRVFTEILSRIKGGSQSGKGPNCILSQEAYVLMSDRKASSLSSQDRERIYNIFQVYEKMKMKHGEFDLADFVMNLHLRLKNKRLEGDQMDFVYIDEVQDLSMGQITLFKYICKNVDEGFVFSGDTAQTISRGIDFRFQDIRSLFYNEFVIASKYDRSFAGKEKGLVTPIFILAQNFRTHAAVLRLAQSIIDLLYHFFPQSIDILKPETSLIYGEGPVLLQPRGNENALETIFGKSANGPGQVGFGAKQVILVRDDSARKEISDYVRNRALVLTIVECKGLEFEDVFLYNFFSSSPLRNQWRIIYQFMEKKDLLDSCLPNCFPSINNETQSILCYELKQLYVAITRTKQRLWISESAGDFSNPIFYYWKKLCLVQVKNVDDSVVQAMQMTSSPAEWRSRGVKLYWEKNYEMATMCFERSGDKTWEKRAKASGLRTTADILRYSNPKEACRMLREAGEIFDSIGRAETAAECFCDLGDYERAGIIYLEKCGESELKRAGECFALARCFKQAAQVYAKGNYISECLSVCTKGKLFDLGLQYIEYWKQLEQDIIMYRRGKELDKIEQGFRESCAMCCHKDKDNKTMMKHVRDFLSMDFKRNFLKSINCFDELLLLEEESGNFKEAAEIAKLRGDLILEADLLGQAGNFQEASLLILSFVLSSSLWVGRSRGWPLKAFAQKEEILKKAISFAKQESDQFYELVCTEARVLSHKYIDLHELCQHLSYSQHHKSHRVELLSMRKILDTHFHYEIVKYVWEDSFADDWEIHSKDTILKNQASIGTLMYFWNLWKENMLNVLRYLEGIEKQDISKYNGYEEFCLNYFGMRKQFSNLNVVYVLLKPGAEWVTQTDYRSICRRKKFHSLDSREFSTYAQSHFRAEMISVGLKVLETLEALYNWSTKASLSMFCQSMCLLDIYQVTSFLIESFKCDNDVSDKLQNLWRLSTKYFENVFPLDCRKSLVKNMISLRQSELSRKLLEEVIVNEISINGVLTYGQIGRVVMIWLALGKPTAYLCKKIGERFDTNLSWKVFAESLSVSTESEAPTESPWTQAPPSFEYFSGVLESGSLDNFTSGMSSDAPMKISVIDKFHIALRKMYFSTWRTNDYIPPNCFLYLVERLLILVCHSMEFFYTTKYSFVEWLMFLQSDSYPSATLVADMQLCPKIALDSVLVMAKEMLYNAKDTAEWIAISNIDVEQYLSLLVLRLMVVIFLLCLNSGEYFDVLSDLLDQVHISSQLPRQFFEALRCGKSRNEVAKHFNVIAEAFKMIGNPIVIVSLQGYTPKIVSPDAISIDIRITRRKDQMMKILFTKEVTNTR